MVRLDALAQLLEGEGLYNVAKLVRAAGASIIRSAAYHQEADARSAHLAEEVRNIAGELSAIKLDIELLDALRAGATAIAEGRLPLIDETPNPYVCRRCGHVRLVYPEDNCPRCNSRPRTFERFPPVYWLEAMDPMEVTKWLESTPLEVRQLIEGISEVDLSREIVEGEWTLKDLLTHLRDAQGVLDFRINLLVEKDNPIIESKAVFKWATDDSARPASSMDIFDTYLDSRRGTVETLREIPLDAWWREGKHEEFGTINIKQQASYFATHELTHLPQFHSLIDRLTAS
jgi:hypothetical protein